MNTATYTAADARADMEGEGIVLVYRPFSAEYDMIHVGSLDLDTVQVDDFGMIFVTIDGEFRMVEV